MLARFDFRTERGVATRIEVLLSVYGVAPSDLENEAALIEIPEFRMQVRLPNPVACLKMKTHNAVGLDQRHRQDVKQVKMLILCSRAFLRDLLKEAESGKIAERLVIKGLEALFTFRASELATIAVQKYGFDWSQAFPVKELLASSLSRVQNFVQHRLLPAFPHLALIK